MKDSAIQWTDHTFNPWEGCTKVAPECKNCYAETLVDHRFGRAKWGKGQPRRRTSENLWKQPLRWNEMPMVCGDCGKSFNFGYEVGQGCPNFCSGVLHRARVFCLSLGDWLDEEVSIEWLADLLFLVWTCQNLDWQLLTKRPENWRHRVALAVTVLFQKGLISCSNYFFYWLREEENNPPLVPSNIWIGVSAGADQRAALEIPAKVHFLSCEPMLHALDEEQNHITQEFDWIIFGGESGKLARPLQVDWIRMGLAFCCANKVSAFVKQLGRYVMDRNDAGFDGDEGDWPMGTEFRELDSGYQGAPVRILLKDSHGGDMSEWPEALRVRDFPKLVTGHLS